MKNVLIVLGVCVLTAALIVGVHAVLAKEQYDFSSLINFWETKIKSAPGKPKVLALSKTEAVGSLVTAPKPEIPTLKAPEPLLPETLKAPEAEIPSAVAPSLPPSEEVALLPEEKAAAPEAETPAETPVEVPAAEVSVETAETAAPAPVFSIKRPDDEILLVDDFDSGVRSNLLGGAMGEWSKDEYDDTQGCEVDFVERPRLGKSGGYAMQISYDVDSPSQAYNGVWIKLEGLDARPYKYLVFYLKAPNYPPYGTDNLKLELKNRKGDSGSYRIKRIPRGAWREYKVPLNKFKGLKDLSDITELIIVFEDKTANPKEGIVFLEHVYFTKGEIRRPG